jgi:copper chaperone CopZ
MKFLTFFLVILITTILSANEMKSDEKPTTLEIQVEGMVCGHCAQGIKEMVKDEKFVEKLFISVEHGLVAIEIKKDHKIENKEIEAIFKKTGFEAKKIARKSESLENWKKELLEKESNKG